MYLRSLRQMASLALHFRNGHRLVQCMRSGQPCDEVVLWDGTHIAHPPQRGGLLEAVVELWLERVYTEGFYRPEDGDVIVDAGANVGFFAIQVARRNTRCRVIALEPFAENFRYLQANVARACPQNVTCLEMALGGEFSRGRMQAIGSRSLDHVLHTDASAAAGIPVVPLSGLLELAGKQEIDFLKVDIEGSEHQVFAAASPDLFGRCKRIAMEYHDHLVPGTLDLLCRVLSPTHDITVHPASMAGCGILRARRRDLEK